MHPWIAGLGAIACAANNAGMVKRSQIYGWDEEPVDERPSEFSSSTGYSVLSGYHPMNDPGRRQASRSHFGFKTLVASCVMLLALGGYALVKLAPLLRGASLG